MRMHRHTTPRGARACHYACHEARLRRTVRSSVLRFLRRDFHFESDETAAAPDLLETRAPENSTRCLIFEPHTGDQPLCQAAMCISFDPLVQQLTTQRPTPPCWRDIDRD